MDGRSSHIEKGSTYAEAYAKVVRDFLSRLGVAARNLGVSEDEFAEVTAKEGRYTFIPKTEVVFEHPKAWRSGFKLEMPDTHFEVTFKEQIAGGQKILRAVMYIDRKLREDSLKTISAAQLDTLVQNLRALFALANHDFTMHQAKFYNHSQTHSIANEILEYPGEQSENLKRGQRGFRILQIEQLAAAFHKLLFERAYAQSPLLRRFVQSRVQGSLDTIACLPPESRQKWYSVFKFLYYSLFDPESREALAVRAAHPRSGDGVGMEAGRWAASVAQRVFPLRKDFFDRMPPDGGRLRRELLHGEPYLPREIGIEKLFEILYLKPELIKTELPEAGRRRLLREIFEASTPSAR